MRMTNAACTRLVVTHTSAVDELRRRCHYGCGTHAYEHDPNYEATTGTRDFERGGQHESLLYDHVRHTRANLSSHPTETTNTDARAIARTCYPERART